ncbi:MAG: hypothetical protein IKX44_02190 [Prevotella sp.]|nr:hypothetical protein [Prevotella sp.]
MKNDDLFRQALQRQNDRAAGMNMPDDMEQRVMKRIHDRQGKSRQWSIVAAAASVAVLLAFAFWPKQQQPTTNSNTNTVIVENKQNQPEAVPNAGTATTTQRYDNYHIAVQPLPHSGTKTKRVVKTPSPTAVPSAATPSQLNSRIAHIEKQVDVPDEISKEAQPEKLIAATENSTTAVAQALPAASQSQTLTERDIPITRPENYRHTPEELELLRKQANEAYLKWAELELEIAKYHLEQTAQQ